jgi:hypothetical protein|tara:strand:- start:1109 stop:1486 length:378 start_codon:yes stop_codon:yes gene_type:complete
MRDKPHQQIIYSSHIMRKIESQMNRAIRTQSNWAGSNTTVSTSDNGLQSKVFLHGNHIATYFHVERQLQIFDGGWQSVTTKSRLNALCYEFVTGVRLFQKNWTWYVSGVNRGSEQFFNGQILEWA